MVKFIISLFYLGEKKFFEVLVLFDWMVDSICINYYYLYELLVQVQCVEVYELLGNDVVVKRVVLVVVSMVSVGEFSDYFVVVYDVFYCIVKCSYDFVQVFFYYEFYVV